LKLESVDHKTVTTNGVQLHVAEAGPKDGPLVVLLHGFPECWYGWRYQLPYLASLGYRVWAPDQRGYGESSKPQGVGAYELPALVNDILGLLDSSGTGKMTLVGHDWGGLVAWWLGLLAPERLDKLIILNAPHPEAMRARLWYDVRQMVRSWYMLYFQLPWVPELIMKLSQGRLLEQTMLRSSRKGTFSEVDMEQYRRAWMQPDTYTCMLNWYRALVQRSPAVPQQGTVSVPTLLIWGAKDAFLRQELAKQSLTYCKDGRLEWIEEATHWVQHEEAVRVNELIRSFIKQ
jgi:epoxide hydrolase 4